MKIETETEISKSRKKVYELLRDDPQALIPYMDNVRDIKTADRIDNSDGTVSLTNHWYSQVDLPAIVEKFISKEMFSWKDFSLWNNKKYQVTYEVESMVGGNFLEVRGVNTIKAISAQRCTLHTSVDVIIHAEKVPGLPKFFAKKVMAVVEPLAMKTLKENYSGLGKGVVDYYKHNS